LAHWTITQRTIHVVLPKKTAVSDHGKSTFAQTISATIRGARKQAGLTQKKLAEITGIHRQWHGRWERGRALPSLAAWTKLSAWLNLPAPSLFPIVDFVTKLVLRRRCDEARKVRTSEGVIVNGF